ncbi:hypothetical protein E2R68_00180 [Psychromonas sp. RZ22]|uniref:hypothetical protein n=1 Tax=Psychromonas algarum TaxID=2555643 RepID=UPI001068CE37|nr:hypothetical protein [Psychromonas sp. RZ22]TEW56493.1 hypothetical protein E2R68_00180 [Psychromonas sp. RZ22]
MTHEQLSPIEQVWNWLRQNEVANRCFKDYNDIVDKHLESNVPKRQCLIEKTITPLNNSKIKYPTSFF